MQTKRLDPLSNTYVSIFRGNLLYIAQKDALNQLTLKSLTSSHDLNGKSKWQRSRLFPTMEQSFSCPSSQPSFHILPTRRCWPALGMPAHLRLPLALLEAPPLGVRPQLGAAR
jgi:hypothetical protein